MVATAQAVTYGHDPNAAGESVHAASDKPHDRGDNAFRILEVDQTDDWRGPWLLQRLVHGKVPRAEIGVHWVH